MRGGFPGPPRRNTVKEMLYVPDHSWGSDRAIKPFGIQRLELEKPKVVIDKYMRGHKELIRSGPMALNLRKGCGVNRLG